MTPPTPYRLTHTLYTYLPTRLQNLLYSAEPGLDPLRAINDLTQLLLQLLEHPSVTQRHTPAELSTMKKTVNEASQVLTTLTQEMMENPSDSHELDPLFRAIAGEILPPEKVETLKSDIPSTLREIAEFIDKVRARLDGGRDLDAAFWDVMAGYLGPDELETMKRKAGEVGGKFLGMGQVGRVDSVPSECRDPEAAFREVMKQLEEGARHLRE